MATADGADGLGTQLITIAVLLGVGVVIVSQLGVVGGSFSGGSLALGGDAAVTVAVASDDVAEVADTTGRAMRVDGDGGVSVDGGFGGVANDSTMSFATYADVDNTSRGSRLIRVGDAWALNYIAANGGQYELLYFNISSRNSYRLTVAADQTPGTLQPVIVERNGATVRLYNGTGASASLTIDPSSESTAQLSNVGDLDGRIDETRAWDRPLNATERATYRSDGIEPVAVGNRSARLQFDTTGDSVAIDFVAASGRLSGTASRGDGLDKTVLQQGTDFTLAEQDTETTISVIQGGALTDQPRVAVQTSTPFREVLVLTASAFGLGGVVMVVVVARRVIQITREI